MKNLNKKHISHSGFSCTSHHSISCASFTSLVCHWDHRTLILFKVSMTWSWSWSRPVEARVWSKPADETVHLNGRTKRVDYQIKKQVFQREILGYIENPSWGQGLQLKHFWLSCTVCVIFFLEDKTGAFFRNSQWGCKASTWYVYCGLVTESHCKRDL